MRKDNMLLQAATRPIGYMAYLNARRLNAWRLRWYLAHGEWPASGEITPITTPVADGWQRAPIHTNAKETNLMDPNLPISDPRQDYYNQANELREKLKRNKALLSMLREIIKRQRSLLREISESLNDGSFPAREAEIRATLELFKEVPVHGHHD